MRDPAAIAPVLMILEMIWMADRNPKSGGFLRQTQHGADRRFGGKGRRILATCHCGLQARWLFEAKDFDLQIREIWLVALFVLKFSQYTQMIG